MRPPFSSSSASLDDFDSLAAPSRSPEIHSSFADEGESERRSKDPSRPESARKSPSPSSFAERDDSQRRNKPPRPASSHCLHPSSFDEQDGFGHFMVNDQLKGTSMKKYNDHSGEVMVHSHESGFVDGNIHLKRPFIPKFLACEPCEIGRAHV